MDSLLTGAAVFLLYLCLPSYLHNFDGVACAIAVELGDVKHLLHGNHLLYGPAGYAFYRLLRPLGIDALWSLKLFDSLLGALGGGLMHSLLRREGFSRKISVLCAVGMALSYGYWLWSLEAQVYLLGLVFLLAALRESLSQTPDPYRLAVWHALAMLSHGANALFFPAAVYALGRRDLGRYLIAAAILVAAGYGAAWAWVRPRNLADARLWLLGSAALGPGRSFLWHGGALLDNVRSWVSMSALVVCAARPLALPLWGAALWSLARFRPQERALAISCGLWLAAYSALFLAWEPFTMVYRVSDLAPLWLLAALALARAFDTAAGKSLALLYLAALGGTNLALGILPVSRPEANAQLQEALWLGRNTPENAWIATEGALDVYVPYFARRRPLILSHLNPEEAARRLLSGPLYATSRSLNGLRSLLPQAEPRPVGDSGRTTFYEVVLRKG